MNRNQTTFRRTLPAIGTLILFAAVFTAVSWQEAANASDAVSGPTPTPAASLSPIPTPSPFCSNVHEYWSHFSNPEPIAPADRVSNDPGSEPGLPTNYPSIINVSGSEVPDTCAVLGVAIDFTLASERPDDLDILVMNPQGTRSLIISDGGGDGSLARTGYLFGRNGPLFPDASAPPAGYYTESNYSGLPGIEPEGKDNFPTAGGLAQYPAGFGGLGGGGPMPAGAWKLYVVDDETNNLSSLPDGWRVSIFTYCSAGGCVPTPTPSPSPSPTPSPTPTPTPTPTPSPSPSPSCEPGSLDLSFDGDGKVTTAIRESSDRALGIVIQPDRKIIAVGHSLNGPDSDFALVRYNVDGSLDTTFGGSGKVTTSLSSVSDYASSVALQLDGKIVVAGIAYNGPDSDFAVARYNPDGSLDTTFGTDGKVTTDVRGGGGDWAHSVLIQPDGKIVAAGGSNNIGPGFYDFALVRYNPDGSLDPTFDGDGKVTTGIWNYDSVSAIALQSDGKIVAAGYGGGPPDFNFAFARYNNDGSLDLTFSEDGKAMVSTSSVGNELANSVAIQSDGKIVAAGMAHDGLSNNFVLVRLNKDGLLDATFDGDGRVTTPILAGDDTARSVAIRPNGKIIAAGSSHNGSNDDFALAAYNPDGSLDTTFDGDGKVTTPVLELGDWSQALAIQSDGRVVAAGFSDNGSNVDFSLVRYGRQCVNSVKGRLFDYDGDGRTDFSVFRPSSGAWYLQRSTLGFQGLQFGAGGDKLAPADYDGDGKTDIAIYRPSTGLWYILNSATHTVTYPVFGVAEDLPAPGDYDGDGKADLTVFRPSQGTWYRQNSSNGSFFGMQFGAIGDVPTVGDFDGDGKNDLGIWRPSNGDWYNIRSADGSVFGERFGQSGDKIAPADYDGDGKTDIAIFRPSTGLWVVRNSATATYSYFVFGAASDIPVAGDYDGDGKADIGVWRPSDGTWYMQRSDNGQFIVFPWGQDGDRPTPGAYGN